MTTTIKKLMAAAALVLAAPLASATVLNFDDLTGIAPLTTYGGLTFVDWNYFDFAQSPYTAASGNTRIFNSSNVNSFGRATAFTFQGAKFAGEAGVAVRFDMFLNGAYVASSGVLGMSDSPTFLASGYTGLLDSVTVSSNKPDFFVLDDLTFNEAATVPEPGSLALLFGAMGVMGFMGRRRRKA
jgi:hypothetical protein